jgi:hypothetical protein
MWDETDAPDQADRPAAQSIIPNVPGGETGVASGKGLLGRPSKALPRSGARHLAREVRDKLSAGRRETGQVPFKQKRGGTVRPNYW